MIKIAKKLKFLVFELKGDYGFFKKPETTTSPISFYFPPRTTILGIIAAIMGEPKDSYHEKDVYSDKNCKIALKINNKINSVFYNTNTAEFSNSLITNRMPTKYTYLRNPCYTVYIHLNDSEILLKLKDRLINTDIVYTISLGLANLFARIEKVDEIELEEVSNTEKENFLAIKTVIPFFRGTNRIIEEGEIQFENEILKTNMPRLMNNQREVLEYCTYIYERNGKPINLKWNNQTEVYNGKSEIIAIL